MAFKLVESEGFLFLDQPLPRPWGRFTMAFPTSASVDGQLLETGGKGAAGGRVTVTFGWAAGMADSAYAAFNRVVGTKRALRLTTDNAGRFRIVSLPSQIFVGFQQLASERHGFRYRIDSDMPRHRASCFVAPESREYRVRSVRELNPILRIGLRTEEGIVGPEAAVCVQVARTSQPAGDVPVFPGRPGPAGEFECPLGLADAEAPAEHSGRTVWISVFHPKLGLMFAAGKVDILTWRLDVKMRTPPAPLSIAGRISASSLGVKPFELVLSSDLFPGLDLAKTSASASGEFRFDRLCAPPHGWPSADADGRDFVIKVLEDGHPVLIEGEHDSRIRVRCGSAPSIVVKRDP